MQEECVTIELLAVPQQVHKTSHEKCKEDQSSAILTHCRSISMCPSDLIDSCRVTLFSLKSLEFSSLLFSQSLQQLCLEISISFKLTQPLRVSTVQLLYTVKEKGGKPDTHTHMV